MKKTIIGLAIAAVIGVGGYTLYNKADDVVEQHVTKYIKTYQEQPLVITSLENDKNIDTAQWQVISSDGEYVRSTFTVKLAGGEEAVIPLVSHIIRGKTEFEGASYGFGKIVTKVDLTEVKEVPFGITEDTFTSTQYIALDGEVLSVDEVDAISEDKVFTFAGLIAKTQWSALQPGTLSSDIAIDTFTLQKDDSTILSKPTKLTFSIDKDGNYTGESQPMFFSVGNDAMGMMDFTFGKATHEGVYKSVDGLSMPISHGESKYESITLKFDSDKDPIILNNVVGKGGVYEAGDERADLKLSFTGDIAPEFVEKALKAQGIQFVPQSVEFTFSNDNIPYVVLNDFSSVSDVEPQDELSDVFSDEQLTEMLSETQTADTEMSVAFSLVTDKGDADIEGDVRLNDFAKKATLAEMRKLIDSDADIRVFIDADAKAVIDEDLADSANVSGMLQMMLGLAPQNGKYTMEAEVSDGKTTLNGQVMP